MKKLLTLLVIAAMSTGCSKTTDSKNNADPCTTGNVKFVNNSDNPYNVYDNGSLIGQQKGNSHMNHEASKGSHVFKVEQVSGYLLYPTIKEYTTTIEGCEDEVVSYP